MFSNVYRKYLSSNTNSIIGQPRFYLSVSLCLIVAALLIKGVSRLISNEHEQIEQISLNVEGANRQIDNQIFDLSKKLKSEGNLGFDDLHDDYTFPLYVFQNQALVYWSTSEYPIEHRQIAGYYKEKCLVIGSSLFLVKKSRLVAKNSNYEVVVTLPLRHQYKTDSWYLKSGLNSDVFPNKQAAINLNPDKGRAIYSKYGTYLFSVELPESPFVYRYQNLAAAISFFMGVLCLLLSYIRFKHLIQKIEKPYYALAFLVVFFSMLLIGIKFFLPFESLLLHSVFQESRFEKFSVLSYVFFYTLLSGAIITFHIRYFKSFLSYKKIIGLPQQYKQAIATALVVLSFGSAFLLNQQLLVLFRQAGISFDIVDDLSFPFERLLALSIFLIGVGIYFAANNFLAQLFIKLNKNFYNIAFAFASGAIAFYLLSFFLRFEDLVVFNLHSIYFAFITFLYLPIKARRSGYGATFYLMICSSIVALLCSYQIFNDFKVKEIEKKNRFASELLRSNPLDEIYLKELMGKIRSDKNIRIAFSGPSNPKEVVPDIVRRNYLDGSYFEQFDVELYLTDQNGLDNRQVFSDLSIIPPKEQSRIEQNIYIKNDVVSGKRLYLCLIQIQSKAQMIGAIVLIFSMPNPDLQLSHPIFSSEQLEHNYSSKQYSYAVYKGGELEYSYGDFPYTDNFIKKFSHPRGFLLNEIPTEDYHHLRFDKDIDRSIIISSRKYLVSDFFSNFSFIFLLCVFFFFAGFVVYSLSLRRSGRDVGFSTKIQFYLNVAFFLPLVLISILTISILGTSDKTETRAFYLENANTISNNLYNLLKAYREGAVDQQDVEKELRELSAISQSDIQLYNNKGFLVGTNQQKMVQSDLLGSFINPKAFISIIEQRQRKALISENIGDFTYNTAYVGVFSFDNGEIIGVVGIPFFGSKYRFDSHITDLFTTILKVFTGIFVMLVALSYLSVLSLVKPLKLLTQKIKKTSLSTTNTPLVYNSDDEIGLLVGEYNKMLVNMEHSTKVLRQSEKETAWREMAQQVAHEIKNPLTPMRLSLQQLERVHHSDTSYLKRSINMLMTQVDNLNDIATSFSAFAKMPIPKEEQFEISKVLRQTINLYKSSDVALEQYISDGDFLVLGDEQLMSRIFTNLILNGIQSVPEGRRPSISISLTPVYPAKVLIEFTDNGEGIPEHIRNKIFVPNFSTKIKGSGIGLAIAKRGIEHSGGSIWFNSEEGIGTSFYIEMPLISEKNRQVVDQTSPEKSIT